MISRVVPRGQTHRENAGADVLVLGMLRGGDAAVAERPGEDQISHLSGIQEQLERIHRVIMFEKSSAWNVVAAVVQCLAIMLLIAAAFRWLEKPIELIVVALTFQVMALTFFVKGK